MSKCKACGSTRCNHTQEDVDKTLEEYKRIQLEDQARRDRQEQYFRDWGD